MLYRNLFPKSEILLRIFSIVLTVTCCYSFAFSQQIDITVKRLNIERALLSSLSGETVTQIDSFNSSGNGRFLFSLDREKNHLGFYRLSFDNKKWIDFMHDNEDVTIITDADDILDSLQVISSVSNQLYYSFQKLNTQYKTKSELLQLILARYPKDDPYYTTTQTTLSKLQSEYSTFVSNTSQVKPSSFVARYIRSARLPIVD